MYLRPRTRAECVDGPRPCPWVACRYHLFLDVNEATGRIKFNFPGLTVSEIPSSCALDLADGGELNYEEIGRRLNVTRERVRQLTNLGIENMWAELFPEQDLFSRAASGAGD